MGSMSLFLNSRYKTVKVYFNFFSTIYFNEAGVSLLSLLEEKQMACQKLSNFQTSTDPGSLIVHLYPSNGSSFVRV